jgi:hypothetical protein
MAPELETAVRWVRQSLAGVAAMWAEPADARGLAICRVLLFSKGMEEFTAQSYRSFVDVGAAVWKPHSVFVLLEPPSATTVKVLVIAYTTLCYLATFGVAFRVTALGAAFLSLYLHGLLQNFGKIMHTYHLFSIALLVVGASRAADVWSVDAIVKWLRGGRRGSPLALPPNSAEYRWPVLFVCSTVFVMYGAAGLSKLVNSGWAWALSDSFRQLRLEAHFTGEPPTRIGVWLADHPALCQFLALMALLTEVLAWLGLLNRRLFWFFGLGAMGLQFGIWLLMGVTFAMLPTIFCFFIPWTFLLRHFDGLLQRLRDRLASPRAAPS